MLEKVNYQKFKMQYLISQCILTGSVLVNLTIFHAKENPIVLCLQLLRKNDFEDN